jgi:hypothetical protein
MIDSRIGAGAMRIIRTIILVLACTASLSAHGASPNDEMSGVSNLGFERGQIVNAGQSLAIGRLCKTKSTFRNAEEFKLNALKYGNVTRAFVDREAEKVATKFAAEMKGKPKELQSWCKAERMPPSPNDEIGD